MGRRRKQSVTEHVVCGGGGRGTVCNNNRFVAEGSGRWWDFFLSFFSVCHIVPTLLCSQNQPKPREASRPILSYLFLFYETAVRHIIPILFTSDLKDRKLGLSVPVLGGRSFIDISSPSFQFDKENTSPVSSASSGPILNCLKVELPKNPTSVILRASLRLIPRRRDVSLGPLPRNRATKNS